jgi:uncharacterized protein YndB with AHSA1/START domain/ketosteroid isomerase-like protein
MSSEQAITVVRRYHEGWTSKNYEQAIELLAPNVKVEVPINDYPTADSFARALRGFGDLVTDVELLSEMSSGDEAMLLYDMHVEQLGAMRVVEHFTVSEGKITRLRQIHDTAALRPARMNTSVSSLDYTRELRFDAPAERVFDALTTLDGLAGWWTAIASGTPTAGRTINLGFDGLDEEITMHVEQATRPSTVVWSCLLHTAHPEWEGTTIVFELIQDGLTSGLLKFRHIGLIPTLTCYETCESGWDHFLSSLLGYAEEGEGSPFSAGAQR